MNELLEIGFQLVGHWLLTEDSISFELRRHGGQKNILYAFVCEGDVLYVGKTTQTLSKRLYGYKNPGAAPRTNLKNNENLKKTLQSGAVVDIFALPDNGLLHYGTFHINLAAGLEDSIIATLNPEWNGRPKNNQPAEPIPPIPSPQAIGSFSIVLHNTYFNSGFFNVPTKQTTLFGSDGDQIDIFCGSEEQPITGLINRKSNATNTPRIMGGKHLRDWLQANTNLLDKLLIHVRSPNEIHIAANLDE